MQDLTNVVEGDKITKEWVDCHDGQLFIAAMWSDSHHVNHLRYVLNPLPLHAAGEVRRRVGVLQDHWG